MFSYEPVGQRDKNIVLPKPVREFLDTHYDILESTQRYRSRRAAFLSGSERGTYLTLLKGIYGEARWIFHAWFDCPNDKCYFATEYESECSGFRVKNFHSILPVEDESSIFGTDDITVRHAEDYHAVNFGGETIPLLVRPGQRSVSQNNVVFGRFPLMALSTSKLGVEGTLDLAKGMVESSSFLRSMDMNWIIVPRGSTVYHSKGAYFIDHTVKGMRVQVLLYSTLEEFISGSLLGNISLRLSEAYKFSKEAREDFRLELESMLDGPVVCLTEKKHTWTTVGVGAGSKKPPQLYPQAQLICPGEADALIQFCQENIGKVEKVYYLLDELDLDQSNRIVGVYSPFALLVQPLPSKPEGHLYPPEKIIILHYIAEPSPNTIWTYWLLSWALAKDILEKGNRSHAGRS